MVTLKGDLFVSDFAFKMSRLEAIVQAAYEKKTSEPYFCRPGQPAATPIRL